MKLKFLLFALIMSRLLVACSKKNTMHAASPTLPVQDAAQDAESNSKENTINAAAQSQRTDRRAEVRDATAIGLKSE